MFSKTVLSLFNCLVPMVKNDQSQSKIAKNLWILPSVVHNIIKRFRESGAISCTGQEIQRWMSVTLDPWDNCIKNWHNSVMSITLWAQEHFGKPLWDDSSLMHPLLELKTLRKLYIINIQKFCQLLLVHLILYLILSHFVLIKFYNLLLPPPTQLK